MCWNVRCVTLGVVMLGAVTPNEPAIIMYKCKKLTFEIVKNES
jgi:hypothetical protein